MERDNVISGSFGFVVLENGRAVKRPFGDEDVSMNREYIAHARMCRAPLANVARLVKCKIKTVGTGTKLVKMLSFEDAGFDLSKMLERHRFFDPVDVLLRPLLSALRHLDRLGIVHGDIHPANICLRRDAAGGGGGGGGGDGIGRLTARLIDFGRSMVVREESIWDGGWLRRRSGGKEFWIEPLTGLLTDQKHLPTPSSNEAEIDSMYNGGAYRDPMALVGLAVNHMARPRRFPLGLTLGAVDDVYALVACVVRFATPFLDRPWNLWNLFNQGSLIEPRFDQILRALGDVLQWNPAWDASSFSDLHLKIRPDPVTAADPISATIFREAVSAVETRLRDLDTLFPLFFDRVAELYDDGTSELVRGCLQPDRRRRYHPREKEEEKKEETIVVVVVEEEEEERAEAESRHHRQHSDDDDGEATIAVVTPVNVVVNKDERAVHVLLEDFFWIMTGIVESGRVRWWHAVARGDFMASERGRVALKLFVDEAVELDGDLKGKPCRDWPFDVVAQREAWLKVLALHDDDDDDAALLLLLEGSSSSKKDASTAAVTAVAAAAAVQT